MRFAKRSSTRAGLLVGAVAAAAVVAVAGLGAGIDWLAFGGLAAAIAGAGAFAAYLIVTERRRHEAVEEENARLLVEAQQRETQRARLSEQLITAEQDERRRLADFLHDGAVQSLSGVALMLDAVSHSIEGGRLNEAQTVLSNALERNRNTIRSLRDLSFALEPVVLRDQGFGPAVRELADRLAIANDIEIDLDVDAGDTLNEKAQVGLYQLIREALGQALLRGPPRRVFIRVAPGADRAIETVIEDDGTGERRRRSLELIEERARTLNGELTVEQGPNGGTTVRVILPAYAARR